MAKHAGFSYIVDLTFKMVETETFYAQDAVSPWATGICKLRRTQKFTYKNFSPLPGNTDSAKLKLL